MSVVLLMKGMLFGIGAAAPIGPVNVEIARRALRGGFFPAFALGCGAVTIDVIYASISSIGVAPLLDHRIFYWPLTVTGLGLLAIMGIMSLCGAREVARADLLITGGEKASSHRSGYVTGLLMTGMNPFTLAFWFVVLPKWAGTITGQPASDLPIIVIGVFVATIGWVIVFAGLLSFAGRWRKPWWLVAADEFGGAMLLGLSAYAFLRSFQPLL